MTEYILEIYHKGNRVFYTSEPSCAPKPDMLQFMKKAGYKVIENGKAWKGVGK